MASGDGLFPDASIDLHLDLKVDLDLEKCLDIFAPAYPVRFGTVPNLWSVRIPLDSDEFDNQNELTLDCSVLPDLSTPPLTVQKSTLTPIQTPPSPTTAVPCLVQNGIPCITTATQSLRSLHITHASRISRRRGGSHDHSGLDPPRMSGLVL